MSEKTVESLVFSEAPPQISEFRRFLRVFMGRKVVLFGLVIIVIFIIVAIFAPFIAPYDPYEPDPSSSLAPLSAKHLLGTDAIGRDTLSRVIFGSRISLLVALSAIGFGASAGLVLGLLAGYFGSVTYQIIMRIVDALMSFPMILLALAIASLLGGGLKNIIIALSVGLVPGYARLMCGMALSVKETDYVMAGRSMGASHARIMLRHIIPNCLPPLIVMVTLMIGATILAEAGLSFLGVGVTPPEAAWGSMINDGYQRIRTYPILSFAPGVAIMLVVFSFNMVGDGLRDALDPRLRGTL
jgi:peptide/nickel transport system permease protein